MIAQLRLAAARLQAYQRRFGWWRTLRRALLGPSPGPAAPPVDEPPAVADPPTTTEPEPVAPTPEPVAPPPRPPWTPLNVFHTPARGRKRITLVADSMAGSDRPNGVGTTIILGCLLAHRGGADLRLVTRAHPPQPVNLHPLLQSCGVTMSGEIQCRHLPVDDDKAELDLLDGELLITDTWWNAAAALAVVEPARVVCLLQADERRAGAGDDERLRCEALLRHRGLQWVVRTAALQQQLVRGGFDHFATQALTFEPALAPDPQHPARGQATHWPATLEPVLAHLAARI